MSNEIDSGIYRIHKNKNADPAGDAGFKMTPELAREIRDISTRLLQEFAGSTRLPQQSYIVQDEHLCGIRYRIENCTAQWKAGGSEIVFLRDGQEVERKAIESLKPDTCGETRRAA
ncbi:MAG: hypothetical protein AAF456_11325 [Planctomycetota bacterium]